MVDYKIVNGKLTPISPTKSDTSSVINTGGDTLTIVEKDTGKVVKYGTSGRGGTGLPSVTGDGNIPTGTVTYTPDLNAPKTQIGIGISTVSGQPGFLKSNVVTVDAKQSSVVGLSPQGAKQIEEPKDGVQLGVITGLTKVVNVLPLPFSINEKGENQFDPFRFPNQVVNALPPVGLFNLFTGNTQKQIDSDVKAGEAKRSTLTPKISSLLEKYFLAASNNSFSISLSSEALNFLLVRLIKPQPRQVVSHWLIK